MPEQFKQFDFSKEEDREKFGKLKKAEQREIAQESEEEAYWINDKAKELAGGADPKKDDYEKAIDILKTHKQRINYSLGYKPFDRTEYIYKELDSAIKLNKSVNLPSRIIQEVVEESLPHYLADGKTDIGESIIHGLNLPEIIVQEAAKRGLMYCLTGKGDHRFNINGAVKIIEIFDLSSKIVQESVKQGLIDCLSKGYLDHLTEVKNQFNLSKEIINSLEFQAAVKQGFVRSLSSDSLDRAIEIKKQFDLSEVIVQEATRQMLIDNLFEGKIDVLIKIKDGLNLPETIVQEVVKEGLIKCLSRARIIEAIKIKNTLNLSQATLNSPEIQRAAKETLIACCAEGRWVNQAIQIKDNFSVAISTGEIILQSPALGSLIKEISQFAPEFKSQVEKSSDLAIELCRFIGEPEQLINNLKENPFLVDAIANNPRFSSRLLIKYPQFDKESKGNIEKQFSVKKKIMAENPEMDPESLEFRQLMQKELKEFKNNSEITKAIEKQGINLEEWLNYSETSYFNLSTGGNEIAFSEKIKTPIDRIKETIDSYAYTIKSVLKEYRPEMEKYEIILEDAKLIETQIAKMEVALKQAKTEGNDKKVQGIEKGLVSQKEKLGNLKKGWLWDKLTGEIAAFQRLKNDCFEAQKRLMEAENKLEQALSGKMPSGKMIQDIKQAITSSKEELRSKFSDLEGRIEEFKTNLPNLISPCLGQERSESLIQEIDQKVAEQFDHFESDRTTVANLFSERGDKETSQLESRPMSIFVWARKQDIDLYQGNYSHLCICIDSAHMGAESTIADYNTDLGIQIVNIWDEAKNEPVTAAWCWLGQNKKGEKALVIDNIESNTLYSSNFSEQLSNELFEYIKEYARKIGVDKVVLGKANNDLPVGSELAKLSEDSGQYEKIGGSNRSDGYFLEAEEKSVKLVWQAEEKKVVKKKSAEVLRAKFKELKTGSVNEKNLEEILKAERRIYAGTGLIGGQMMVEDIKRGNGFEYSVAMTGIRPGKKQAEIVAYIIAVEDETDEGDKSIYLEDIAVLPEAQRQGIGWEAMKEFINKLKAKAAKDGQSVLLDMHLRETSQAFMASHRADLESLGVKLIEEALVPDYYDEGEDSLYQVYEIK